MSLVKDNLRSWWPLLAVVAAVVVLCWLLYAVWRSPQRNALAVYGAFAVPVVLLAGGWVTSAWRLARIRRASVSVDGEELDRAAARLAASVRTQWEAAASERGLAGADPIRVTWGRPSLPLAGPMAAAVSSRRFDPLPGLARAGQTRLAAGDIGDLHAVYGGLGSGRLVIAGPPGSGKSGAAVLLILAALRYREHIGAQDAPKVPVPVLVTAQDWDPRSQPVAAWLTRRLRETYPLFSGLAGAATAAALIAAGKIAVIIDGLDEMAVDLRPLALRALSQQVSFRLVVLSRTAEIASAASGQGVLQGAAAIELGPVDPGEAARYLERVQLDPPPAGWRTLIDRIRADPADPVTKALNSPLTLTLVRDTYDSGDDVREFLDFCDGTSRGTPAAEAVREITDHLLDRVLPAAYAARPGQPAPYDLLTARAALSKIASRLSQDGTRDLQWWRIPGWASTGSRRLLSTFVVGLAVALVVRLVDGLLAGFALGLLAGIFTWFAGRVGGPPQRLVRPQLRNALNWRAVRRALLIGIAIALVAGLAVGLVAGLAVGLPLGIEAGSVSGLLVGLSFLLVRGLGWLPLALLDAFTGEPDSISSLSPATSFRHDQLYGMAVGLEFGLVNALVSGLVALPFGLATALTTVSVVVFVSMLAMSRILTVTFAVFQVHFKWRTPVRLMKFLEDACARGVLRTVGPVYQFRHARLQDRLAAPARRSGGAA